MMKALSRCLRLLLALLALGASMALFIRAGLPDRGQTAGFLEGGGRFAAPEPGSLAPGFSLPSLSGAGLSLAQVRGSATIINFWATWCPPCRREMEALQSLYAADPGRLRVLGLNQGESFEVARQWVDELGLTYDILLDQRGTVSRRYQIRGLPTTFLLDEALIIRRVYFGEVSQERMRQDLALLKRGD